VKCSAYSDIDYSCESSPGTGGPGYHVTLDSEGNVSSYSRPAWTNMLRSCQPSISCNAPGLFAPTPSAVA
jgi:hypothetical protein